MAKSHRAAQDGRDCEMNFEGTDGVRLVKRTMIRPDILADEDAQEHSVTRRVRAGIALSIVGLAQVTLTRRRPRRQIPPGS
jgi:hypothetical protein